LLPTLNTQLPQHIRSRVSSANALAEGDALDALDQLQSLSAKVDGDPTPPDWMIDSPEKVALADEVRVLVWLLGLQPESQTVEPAFLK
jgi:hypothetical protein